METIRFLASMQCQSFLGSLVSANPSWLVGSYKLIANIFPLVFLVFLILSSYEHLVQLYPIKVHVSHNKKIILNWCHYQLQILYSSSMPKKKTSTQLLGRKKKNKQQGFTTINVLLIILVEYLLIISCVMF